MRHQGLMCVWASVLLLFGVAQDALSQAQMERLSRGVAQNITFKSTGTWTAWPTLNVAVTLNNGSNVLRFESTGQDLGNIDQVTVQ